MTRIVIRSWRYRVLYLTSLLADTDRYFLVSIRSELAADGNDKLIGEEGVTLI